jgi:hypothetical protein
LFRRNATHLGSHKFRGTTERARRGAVPHILFAETVIGDLDMPIEGQEDVVELEITIDDSVFMEILQCQAHLGGIKSALALA